MQVQDSYRRLLVPSCRYDSAHDPPLPENFGKLVSIVASSRYFLCFGLRQVGDAVIVAFFRLPFFGNFTFAASPGMVALAVAAVTVADTPRELEVEATVMERALAMPLLFKLVPWVVADTWAMPPTLSTEVFLDTL